MSHIGVSLSPVYSAGIGVHDPILRGVKSMAGKKTNQQPVRVGDRREITITGLGHAGEGVGRLDGFAIFVPGAIPGDRIMVQIEEVKKNHGRGRIVELVRSAADRVVPRCTVSGVVAAVNSNRWPTGGNWSGSWFWMHLPVGLTT